MNVITQVAFSFLNIPYFWGGKNPLTGFDCSGLVEAILDSLGISPPGVARAQDIYHHFMVEGRAVGEYETVGALVFYGKSTNAITHVAMMINDYQVIEAGGGDETTVSPGAAARRGAYVRIRPTDYRKDQVAVIFPAYPEWVLRNLD